MRTAEPTPRPRRRGTAGRLRRCPRSLCPKSSQEPPRRHRWRPAALFEPAHALRPDQPKLCCFTPLLLVSGPFPYEQCRQAAAVTEGKISGQPQARYRVLALIDIDEEIFQRHLDPGGMIELGAGGGSSLADHLRLSSSAKFWLCRIFFTAWLPRLLLSCAAFLGAPATRTLSPVASESGGPSTSRSENQALHHLDFGSEIASKLDRPKLDRTVCVDCCDLHPLLAENERAGRNADDVGVARQLEIDLGIGTGLQFPIRIVGMELDQ